MKYVINSEEERYDDLVFNDNERNTAISIAEVLANKGKKVTVTFAKEDEPSKNLKEVVECEDCACYSMNINPAGRLVGICAAYDIEVAGDFYCAAGVLNEKDGEEW